MLRKLTFLFATVLMTCGMATTRCDAQTVYPGQSAMVQATGQCCQPAPTCCGQTGFVSSWGSSGCGASRVSSVYPTSCLPTPSYSGCYGTSRHRIWNFSGSASSCEPYVSLRGYTAGCAPDYSVGCNSGYSSYSGWGCGLFGYRRPYVSGYATYGGYDGCGSRYSMGCYGGTGWNGASWGSSGSCYPQTYGCYPRRSCGLYATRQSTISCGPPLSINCAPGCCSPAPNCCGATSSVVSPDGMTPVPQATPPLPPNESSPTLAPTPTPTPNSSPTPAPTPAPAPQPAPPTPGT